MSLSRVHPLKAAATMVAGMAVWAGSQGTITMPDLPSAESLAAGSGPLAALGEFHETVTTLAHGVAQYPAAQLNRAEELCAAATAAWGGECETAPLSPAEQAAQLQAALAYMDAR
ncbi:hypothetical protein [Georgenia yuyongxinii]|uniref:Uncharacterized protein n=1 Tax=Georgenia yuyongxinii TaxID=2589797 RepID=A0A552WUF9_9MICO|nr:hypothetical protein [Georgenia yuyongxinii]TRW46422.1 hypothetical protein FJ693_05705 [Georgenia yuyongxinii]